MHVRHVLAFILVCGAFSFVSAAPADAALFINEVLFNPGGFDANRDGTASSTQDEFIELVNTGAADFSLAGWSLADGLKSRHVFAADSLIPAYGFFVVFGGGSPTGFIYVATASTGSLGLNNDADTVFLYNPNAFLIDSFAYTQALTGESFTQFPDGEGAFVPHTTVSQLRFSPETTVDGHPRLPHDENDPVLPEPTPWALMGVGIAFVALRTQRRMV